MVHMITDDLPDPSAFLSMYESCVPWSDLDVARLDVLDDVVVLPALLRDLRLISTRHHHTSAWLFHRTERYITRNRIATSS